MSREGSDIVISSIAFVYNWSIYFEY